MGLLIGFLLICAALTFFIVFTMGDSLTVTEKIKFALGIVFVIFIMEVGSYLIAPYANKL